MFVYEQAHLIQRIQWRWLQGGWQIWIWLDESLFFCPSPSLSLSSFLPIQSQSDCHSITPLLLLYSAFILFEREGVEEWAIFCSPCLGFPSIVKHEFLLRSEIVNLSGQALNAELVELEHYWNEENIPERVEIRRVSRYVHFVTLWSYKTLTNIPSLTNY